MAKTRSSMKRMAIISAIVSLVAFAYKLGLGIISFSIILMVASISTLIVFIFKVVYIKNLTAQRDKKKRAYFLMSLLALSFGVLFLLFAVLKVGGIDTSSKNDFEGITSYIFIGFVVLIFIISILGLKGALEKTDIMVIGLKEITFISALADTVIIEEFLYKVVLSYQDIYFLTIFNTYFPLGIAVIMLTVPVIMLWRLRGYKA